MRASVVFSAGLPGGMRPVNMDSPQHQPQPGPGLDPLFYLKLAGHRLRHGLGENNNSRNNGEEEIRTTMPGLVEAAMFVGDAGNGTMDYGEYADTPPVSHQQQVIMVNHSHDKKYLFLLETRGIK